jgi:Uma2 family endonuclease
MYSSMRTQPDLIILLHENSSLVGEDAIHGAPDILLEVLSPGNPDHDLVRKKELYQKFGVKEYWVINPETKETFGFILEGAQYKNIERLTSKIKSPLPGQEFIF